MRRLVTVLVAVVVLAAPALAKKPPVPLAAPAFALPARSGTVVLDSLRGKVVLVDFWASWCEPCRKSFPWMNAVHQRYAAKGLVIVAINLDKTRGPADKFLEEFPAPFTIAFDPNGKAATAYRVKAMPTSYLIAPDGKVLEMHAGFDSKYAAALEARIAGALSP
jgi:thiol-disulfide isomerase/thioredoxin